MKKLEDFSLEELQDMYHFLQAFQSKEECEFFLKERIQKLEEDKKKSLNVRFNMEMFIKLKIFDPSELKVVRDNHISNLQELIDCDLDHLVGITPSIKQGLLWVRTFYDMSAFEEKEKGKSK